METTQAGQTSSGHESLAQIRAAQPPLMSRLLDTLRANLWIWPPMLALIVLRVMLLHGDPTDFPLDRNINAAFNIDRLVKNVPLKNFSVATGNQVISVKDESPEFPFVALSAWVLSGVGVPPFIAARLFALASAVLTGLGLYVLGRRLGGGAGDARRSAAIGLTALWLYAVDPLAVLMGRALLPDTFMVAAMVWSLVVAGAGQQMDSGAAYRRVLLMGLLLIVAAWAKLPALMFAPAAALALLQTTGWRRWQAWAGVVAAALVTYLAVAAWYRINPLMPLAGLRRISEHTNNVVASWRDLAGPEPARVTLARLVLACTTPGLILALAGWLFLQGRPGQRLWLNAWVVLGLAFVFVTVQANTYWAYAVVPAACLLGALALVGFWRQSRWSAVPLAMAGVTLAWLCPGAAQVREYLLVHPEYQKIRELSDRQIKSGPVLYYGQTTNDLLYFAGKPGLGVADLDQDKILMNLRSGRYPYLLSNRMAGDDVLAEVFTLKPVMATRAGEAILFDASRPATLGEPAPAFAGKAPQADLGGVLRVIVAGAEAKQDARSRQAVISLAFSKGPNYTRPPYVAVEFVHQWTGEAFPVPPIAGGAVMDNWVLPQLQAPVFDRPDEWLLMRYTFEIPAHLPAGNYDLRLSLLEDRRRPTVLGQPVTLPLPGFKIDLPASLDRLPLTIRPAEGIWRLPSLVREPSWLGRPREAARLTSDGHFWLRPSLPPGDYMVEITGRGIPVGAGPQTIWPLLRLQKPGQTEERLAAFDNPSGQTVAFRIRWFGPQDFLHFMIGNPAVDLRERQPFPLYLDAAGGSRSVAIDRITIRQAR